MDNQPMNADDFLRLSEEVWPIEKNQVFATRKSNPACPSVADLTHFGALVEREVLRRAALAQAPKVQAEPTIQDLAAGAHYPQVSAWDQTAPQPAQAVPEGFKPLEPEFARVISDNLWELAGASTSAQAVQSPAEGDSAEAQLVALMQGLQIGMGMRAQPAAAFGALGRLIAEQAAEANVQPKGMPALDSIYAAWRAIGADVAGLEWSKFAALLTGTQSPAPAPEIPAWFDEPFVAEGLQALGLTPPTPREFGETIARRYLAKISRLEKALTEAQAPAVADGKERVAQVALIPLSDEDAAEALRFPGSLTWGQCRNLVDDLKAQGVSMFRAASDVPVQGSSQ